MRILPYELFGSYSKRNLLFEEFIPAGNEKWPSNWKEMPEWKKLQDLGFIETPLKLHILDDYPEIKAGVLKRTGMKDLSGVGKGLQGGWF